MQSGDLLVTTRQHATPRMLIPVARDRGIAEIMEPRDVMVVDQPPWRDTGKTDYPAARKPAEVCGRQLNHEMEADAAFDVSFRVGEH
jgi:hypothetical protein